MQYMSACMPETFVVPIETDGADSDPDNESEFLVIEALTKNEAVVQRMLDCLFQVLAHVSFCTHERMHGPDAIAAGFALSQETW